MSRLSLNVVIIQYVGGLTHWGHCDSRVLFLQPKKVFKCYFLHLCKYTVNHLANNKNNISCSVASKNYILGLTVCKEEFTWKALFKVELKWKMFYTLLDYVLSILCPCLTIFAPKRYQFLCIFFKQTPILFSSCKTKCGIFFHQLKPIFN